MCFSGQPHTAHHWRAPPIMMTSTDLSPAPRRSSTLFTPKLLTVLQEGYTAERAKADLVAGLTVAIVAMPLSMALAIASGVGPERGLFTAIVAGFFISALGGSRHPSSFCDEIDRNRHRGNFSRIDRSQSTNSGAA